MVGDANQMNLRIVVNQIIHHSDRLSVRENGIAVSWRKGSTEISESKYGCRFVGFMQFLIQIPQSFYLKDVL